MRTWIDTAAAAKFERMTECLRLAPDQAAGGCEVVAKARTTWGFVEATSGRPTRIPDGIRVAFGFAPRKSSVPPPIVTPIASVGGE